MHAYSLVRSDTRCATCGNLTECRQLNNRPRWVCFACVPTERTSGELARARRPKRRPLKRHAYAAPVAV